MIVIGAIPLLAEVAVPNGFRPRWIWSTALAHKTEDLSPSFEKNCSFERRRCLRPADFRVRGRHVVQSLRRRQFL